MQPQNSQTSSQTSSQEVDQSSKPVFQQPFRAAEERKGNRLTFILTIALLSAAVMALLGLAMFYFLFRTPDAAYDNILKNLYVMRDSAEIIPDPKKELNDRSEAKLDTTARKEAAERYIAALSIVKKSPILEKDNIVRREYDSDKATIEAYGQSSLDLFETIEIYTKVDSICRDELGSVEDDTGTLAELNEHIAGCSRALAKYPNVPLESFDNAHYRKLVQVYLSVIDAYRSVMMAYEKNDERALIRAGDSLNRSYAAYKLATSGSPEMKNTANPTKQINGVIDSLLQRRSVFFRS